MSDMQYRLAARMAKFLRHAGEPLSKAELSARLLASASMPLSLSERLLERLLDGRFKEQGPHVGLWEWEFPFPPQAEPVVVLDLETTGLSSEQNEIIELALVRVEGGERKVFSSLVNPGVPIPPFISRLTGIRNQDVSSAPDVMAVLEQSQPLLDGATLIIQNAPFDLSFLRPRFRRLGYILDNKVIDTVVWARRALPALPKRGLDALIWAFDLDCVQNRHRALGDVEATLTVAREMYYMMTAGIPRPLGEL